MSSILPGWPPNGGFATALINGRVPEPAEA